MEEVIFSFLFPHEEIHFVLFLSRPSESVCTWKNGNSIDTVCLAIGELFSKFGIYQAEIFPLFPRHTCLFIPIIHHFCGGIEMYRNKCLVTEFYVVQL